ncbi:MAG: hypothetical protein AAFZ87_11515, partial [Planctomycetota bacterium]
MKHTRLRRALVPGAGLFLAALAAHAAPASAAAAPAAPAAQESAPANAGARFMRTRTEAVLRNFQDPNGAALATLPEGTLVRVFRES